MTAGSPRRSARNKPSSVPARKRGRIIYLGPASLPASCGLPGTRAEQAAPRPLFGLAPGGVCHAAPVASGPVRSYRTLSPLPVPRGGHRRSALCGTFRRLTPPGRYPAPCPAELGLSSGGRTHRRSSLVRPAFPGVPPEHRRGEEETTGAGDGSKAGDTASPRRVRSAACGRGGFVSGPPGHGGWTGAAPSPQHRRRIRGDRIVGGHDR